MSTPIARPVSILSEPGFEYVLQTGGDLIIGTPEQLRRIGIGLDITFPERANGHWKRKCIDPRGFEVKLSRWCSGDDIFAANIRFPGREFDNSVMAKPFATGVELREETYGDVYAGTAEALVAAEIVPAGCFPGWPGMMKTIVNIRPDGTLARTREDIKEPGGRHVNCKSKGQRPTFEVFVVLPHEIREERIQAYRWRRDAWERKMNALPRPAPLIDLPGFRSAPKVKLVPQFRVDGNVIHLAPRSEWRAESCPA